MRGPGGGSQTHSCCPRPSCAVGPGTWAWPCALGAGGLAFGGTGGASLSGSGTHLRSWESCLVPAFLLSQARVPLRRFCLSEPESRLADPEKCVFSAQVGRGRPCCGMGHSRLVLPASFPRARAPGPLLSSCPHSVAAGPGSRAGPRPRAHARPHHLPAALGNGPAGGCPPPWVGGRETVWFVTSSKGAAEHTGGGGQARWSQ